MGRLKTGMTWRQKGRARERIMVYGGPGAGKTRAYLSIARRCPTDTFYIIDNDHSIERMLETEFEDLSTRVEYRGDGMGKLVEDREYSTDDGNLVVFHCNGWMDAENALEMIAKEADRNDWLVIDTLTRLWDDVQEWYVRTMHGRSLSDHLIHYKTNNKGSNAAEAQFTDWQFVNPLYHSRVTNVILNPPCNVFVVAEETVVTDMDGKDIQGMYSGFKPKGQKKSGHIVHTVMHMRVAGDKYRMTTMKDRGREELLNVDVVDFAKDYLWDVAKWRPKKVEG